VVPGRIARPGLEGRRAVRRDAVEVRGAELHVPQLFVFFFVPPQAAFRLAANAHPDGVEGQERDRRPEDERAGGQGHPPLPRTQPGGKAALGLIEPLAGRTLERHRERSLLALCRQDRCRRQGSVGVHHVPHECARERVGGRRVPIAPGEERVQGVHRNRTASDERPREPPSILEVPGPFGGSRKSLVEPSGHRLTSRCTRDQDVRDLMVEHSLQRVVRVAQGASGKQHDRIGWRVGEASNPRGCCARDIRVFPGEYHTYGPSRVFEPDKANGGTELFLVHR